MAFFQTPERSGALNGVPGRFYAISAHSAESATFINQTWRSERRPIKGYGAGAYIVAEARYDDSCRNGHNSFTLTAEVRRPGARDVEACGCLHEEIAKVFPELAPLIRWHLPSTDGPMHYTANAVYLAGDRDYNGRRAGEPSTVVEVIQFADVPLRHRLDKGLAPFLRKVRDYDRDGMAAALEVISVAHDNKPGGYAFAPKYDFAGRGPLAWHACAFDTEAEALRFADAFLNHRPAIYGMATAWSEGKARDLDAARRVAVWPDATDEQLCAEPDELRTALAARLPRLLEQFRCDLEAAGFQWSPVDYQAPRADLEG